MYLSNTQLFISNNKIVFLLTMTTVLGDLLPLFFFYLKCEYATGF